jgi:hypothetical protein
MSPEPGERMEVGSRNPRGMSRAATLLTQHRLGLGRCDVYYWQQTCIKRAESRVGCCATGGGGWTLGFIHSRTGTNGGASAMGTEVVGTEIEIETMSGGASTTEETKVATGVAETAVTEGAPGPRHRR